jgi:hypothetical protein
MPKEFYRLNSKHLNLRFMKRKAFLFLLFLVAFALPSRPDQSKDFPATSTEWRDDEANINVVRELNRAYALLPFSREYEGVLDQFW